MTHRNIPLMKIAGAALGLLIACWLVSTTAAAGQERILDFGSRIRVQSDGALTVTETIRVRSAGRKIRHGIYRDFPTRYVDRRGITHRTGFELLSVMRNGAPERFHTKKLSNGIRIYMGSRNRTLRPGIYTWRITYRTTRQIGFFKDFDELYWNVTGNGWDFAIERVRAVVELPPGAEPLREMAYTGRRGQKGRNFVLQTDEDGNPVFSTTAPLGPRHGLTIAVAWPMGLVARPTDLQRFGFLVRDNLPTALALAGLILLLAYYLPAWFRVGRDPRQGTIIPLFTPPKGFSPAAIRFVRRMGFDHKSLAAAIVSMAVKGAIRITEDEKGTYTLEKNREAKPKDLSRGEQRVLRKLFAYDHLLQLKNSNHKRIQRAIEALKTGLNAEFAHTYFRRNTRYLLPGIAITIATLVSIIMTADDRGLALFMGGWLSMWTMGCTMLTIRVFHAWRGTGASTNPILARLGALGALLFALPFYAGEFFGILQFTKAATLPATLVFLLLVIVNVVFWQLIKAPTLKGRRVLDQIEGFRRYLAVAEKERLNRLNPPEQTPELFEKYLPYALALDVENQWAEQFSRKLSADGPSHGYHPSWYAGNRFSSAGLSGFTSGLGGAFSGAVAAASSAPGSSSGSGGGGSSGGGGGGGGGGGW